MVMSFCLMLIYLIVLSSTLAQFVGGLCGKSFGDVWYSSKPFYVLVIGVSLAAVVIKKELAEMKVLSWLLFGSITLFILMSLILLLFNSPSIHEQVEPGQIWAPKPGSATFGAFCTIMVAYGY